MLFVFIDLTVILHVMKEKIKKENNICVKITREPKKKVKKKKRKREKKNP